MGHTPVEGGQSSDEVTEMDRKSAGQPPEQHGHVSNKTIIGCHEDGESQLSDGTTCTYPVSQSQTSHFQVSQMEVCQNYIPSRLGIVRCAWCLIDCKTMMRPADM